MKNKRKQEFISNYLKSGNATQSAQDAGYLQPHSQGPRLLKDAEVIKAIEDFQTNLKKDTQIKVAEIIRDVLRIKNADVRKLYKPNGNLKSIPDLDDDIAFCISEVSETKGKYGTSRRVKLYSKQTAQDMLLKIAGEYVSKISLLQSLDDEALAELVEKLMKHNEK